MLPTSWRHSYLVAFATVFHLQVIESSVALCDPAVGAVVGSGSIVGSGVGCGSGSGVGCGSVIATHLDPFQEVQVIQRAITVRRANCVPLS